MLFREVSERDVEGNYSAATSSCLVEYPFNVFLGIYDIAYRNFN
jgi:hypothetical protein